MIRVRGMAMMSLGSISLVCWYYSGFIGQFLGMPHVDPAHYPYNITQYPYVRVHWPLQLLLPSGVLLFLLGIVVSIVDLIRGMLRRREGH